MSTKLTDEQTASPKNEPMDKLMQLHIQIKKDKTGQNIIVFVTCKTMFYFTFKSLFMYVSLNILDV